MLRIRNFGPGLDYWGRMIVCLAEVGDIPALVIECRAIGDRYRRAEIHIPAGDGEPSLVVRAHGRVRQYPFSALCNLARANLLDPIGVQRAQREARRECRRLGRRWSVQEHAGPLHSARRLHMGAPVGRHGVQIPSRDDPKFGFGKRPT